MWSREKVSLNSMPEKYKEAGEVVVGPPSAGCVPAVSQFPVMISPCAYTHILPA